MKNFFFLLLSTFLFLQTGFAQKSKIQQDRDAILSLTGCYQVDFNFAETFAPDTAYEFHEKHKSSGIEYVIVIEDSEKFISLQHLLQINDSVIIKHWREDWVYENTELMTYYKDNQWKKQRLNPDKVKGQWAQKVYSVEDSPRYQANGTWHHEDGRSFWEGKTDAPLPRREYMERDDYDVVQRNNHIELTSNGWFLEQDNNKIIRSDSGDKILVQEKGMETFTKGNFNCAPALAYWEKNKGYWADVRIVWEKIYAKGSSLSLISEVDNSRLFDKLFDLAKETKSNKKDQAAIEKAIGKHLKS